MASYAPTSTAEVEDCGGGSQIAPVVRCPLGNQLCGFAPTLDELQWFGNAGKRLREPAWGYWAPSLILAGRDESRVRALVDLCEFKSAVAV
jgi:hypothetical protein